MSSLRVGRRIADDILASQHETFQVEADKFKYKEMPRPLSYYYRPHQYATVQPKEMKIIYDFTVPYDHVLHIHQVANNYFVDTVSEWKIDGATFEKVLRFIADINNPPVIKDRYIVAYHSVAWNTTNNSNKAILSEVLIDGIVYHIDDWKAVVGIAT